MKNIKCLLPVIFFCIQTFATNNHADGSQIQFIKNEGQWNNKILFSSQIAGGSIFFEEDCFTYQFINRSDMHTSNFFANPKINGHAFKIHFQNANNNISVRGENIFSNYYNYFTDKDPANWKGHVPAFSQINYQELYNKIDLHVYSYNENLKYDFIAHPGADVSLISLSYEGIDAIEIENGNIKLTTSINHLIELKPYVYQLINNERIDVACEYVLNGKSVSYFFPDGYNKNFDLIIDPATLVFATYSGSGGDNWGFASTNDNAGNLIGASLAFNDEYPTTLGAFDTTFNGGESFWECDIAITKFSSYGTSLLYSTFLGGSGSEMPFSLICNESDEIYILGITGSEDFPCSDDAHDPTFNGGSDISSTSVIDFTNGTDIFLSKLSEDGSMLQGSTYFGGTGNDGINENLGYYNYNDFSRSGLHIDNLGETIIASNTVSDDLPVTTLAFQPSRAGAQDGCIVKFNSDLSNILFCSYFGGDNDEAIYDVKTNSLNEYVICGATTSEDFPVTPDVYSSSYNGGDIDGFITKISEDGSVVSASTFIGTNKIDQVFYLDIDASGKIYFIGQSTGDFPVTGGVYSNTGSSQFISKINDSLNDLIFSTVIGNGSDSVNFSPTAFDVDDCDFIYLTGWGGNVNNAFNNETGDMENLPVTAGAFLSTTDGSDFYILQLSGNAESLMYGSYFGGNLSSEHVDGGG
ncbi:MAG: hypothetical protein H7Y00_07900, partial [Fimbriimonadaceae bacterium]|nr:hypothetical protein [Chitinophagales bacterium]